MPEVTTPMGNQDATTKGPAAKAYANLTPDRDYYIHAAERSAALSIPAVFPPRGHKPGSPLKQPWQNIGARGVNNLSSKMVFALFPPGRNFFRLLLDDEKVDAQAEAQGGDPEEIAAFKEETNQKLVKLEKAAHRLIAQRSDASRFDEITKQLVVAGNVLIQWTDTGTKVIRLDKYVTRRDHEGRQVEICICEEVYIKDLPEEIRDKVKAVDTKEQPDRLEETDLYTHIVRDRDGKKPWRVYQEIKGERVGDEKTYSDQDLPFRALRMISVDGDDYGRSFVSEYIGDLQSLDELTRSVVIGAAAAAQIIWRRSPGATIQAEELRDLEPLSVVTADKDDVEMLTYPGQSNIQTGQAIAQTIQSRLEQAFLLHSAVQRNAERVTAEEVRFVAQELEQSVGGVYSTLTEDWQTPYARLLVRTKLKELKAPDLPKGLVDPFILTGFETLGKNVELQGLGVWVNTMTQTFGPQALAQHLKVKEYGERIAGLLGVDMEALIKTQEEVQAEQTQQLGQQVAGNVAQEATAPTIQALTQQQQQSQGG